MLQGEVVVTVFLEILDSNTYYYAIKLDRYNVYQHLMKAARSLAEIIGICWCTQYKQFW